MNPEHVVRTYLQGGDEFFIQYLHGRWCNALLITSRLFNMGHVLELYGKAALLSDNPKHRLAYGHEVNDILCGVNPKFRIDKKVQKVAAELFTKTTQNFDLGLYDKHSSELEIYLGATYVRDLKYQAMDKNGQKLFPVTVSTKPYNKHFLELALNIRSRINVKNRSYLDKEFLAAIQKMNIDNKEAIDTIQYRLDGENNN